MASSTADSTLVPTGLMMLAGAGKLSDPLDPVTVKNALYVWQQMCGNQHDFHAAALTRIANSMAFIKNRDQQIPLTHKAAAILWRLMVVEIVRRLVGHLRAHSAILTQL